MSDSLCPIESLFSTIVFSSKDWSLNKNDAWIYGIIVGWSDESLSYLKHTFMWSDETVDRLKILHNNFKNLST